MVVGVQEPVPVKHAVALRAQRDQLTAEIDGAPAPRLDALERLAALDERLHAEESLAQHRRVESLVAIHESVRRLSECENPACLIEAAPRELRRACGFTRAMISRVVGSRWVPEVLDIEDGVDPDADGFQAFVTGAQIPLAHMLLETELVRRRIPGLVDDAANDERTFQPIVDAARSASYVVSPILPTRRVIGFFHADRFGDRSVDAADRDDLWTFAEHFGLLFERAVLIERLERQRSELQRAFATAAADIDAVCRGEIELARAVFEPEAPARHPEGATGSRIDRLLTPREREVLELMASGATNTTIAAQLVVSEGTVKSHVKRILRKLHVSNRAEAVARYLHVTRRTRSEG